MSYLSKIPFFVLAIPSMVIAEEVQFENVSLVLPDAWSLNHSIIKNEKGEKVGELIPKFAFEIDKPITGGEDFISAYKQSIETEGEAVFLKSGNESNLYWVCTSVTAYDGMGGSIQWFPRTFWVNGQMISLYSRISCEENFNQAKEIAKSIHEK